MSKDLDSLLGSGENIVLQTRQHWFVLLRTAWVYLLGFIPLGLLLWLVDKPTWLDNDAGRWISYAIIAVIVVLALLVVWRVVQWATERFYLTTTKVVYASGVFNRNVVSTPYVKIDEVTLIRPLLGRMLGFGRLEVDNAGRGKEPLAGLEYLPRPAELYQAVTERSRHQRMLEGGGRDDTDNDGYVDPTVRPVAATAPEPEPPRRDAGDDDRWTPPGSGTSTSS